MSFEVNFFSFFCYVQCACGIVYQIKISPKLRKKFNKNFIIEKVSLSIKIDSGIDNLLSPGCEVSEGDHDVCAGNVYEYPDHCEAFYPLPLKQ